MAAGRIKTFINFQPAITAEDVSVETTRNVKKHKGAYGPIGVGKGQPDYTVTVKFAIPDDVAEFVELADKGIPEDGDDEGFVFTYEKGGEVYNLHGCHIDKDAISSNQDGEASQDITFMALGKERVK